MVKRRPTPRRISNGMAALTLLPAWTVVLVAYLGTMLWTVKISFTASRLLPVDQFVGVDQYVRLFSTDRWITSIHNLVIFGTLFLVGALVLGTALAIAIDQRIRFESAFRTIFLYPYAMSFIVTGLIWQWLMNPGLGLQKSLRDLGWSGFTFDWAVNRDLAVYALVIAALWQASGLVMALMLAGLRGVDPELWKAGRIDGIPTWRIYTSIVLPSLTPMLVTSSVLLGAGMIKAYDLVVALTNGGPGTASELPAKFVMDYLFVRQNIGLAAAASTVMLLTTLAVLTPWIYTQYLRTPGVRTAVAPAGPAAPAGTPT